MLRCSCRWKSPLFSLKFFLISLHPLIKLTKHQANHHPSEPRCLGVVRRADGSELCSRVLSMGCSPGGSCLHCSLASKARALTWNHSPVLQHSAPHCPCGFAQIGQHISLTPPSNSRVKPGVGTVCYQTPVCVKPPILGRWAIVMLQLELEAWHRACGCACSVAAWAGFVQCSLGHSPSLPQPVSAQLPQAWEAAFGKAISAHSPCSLKEVSVSNPVLSALGFLQSPSLEELKCPRAGAPAAGWAVRAGLAQSWAASRLLGGLGTLQPLPRVLRAARCPVGTREGRGTVRTRNLFLCRLHIALKHLNFTLSEGPFVTFTSGQFMGPEVSTSRKWTWLF